MELVNQTPLTAFLAVSQIEGLPHRIGMLFAKATFRFDERGRVELDSQRPLPIFHEEQSTELGDRPRDVMVQLDDRFEVILLASAQAPAGRPAKEQRVRLAVGDVAHELDVIGDRVWTERNGAAVMSEPEPFERMPLTWTRAFGGECWAEIDDGAFVPLQERMNRHGRGFDAAALARACAQELRCPDGYPRVEGPRRLPNLEDPSARIRGSDDAPLPRCWATLPLDSGLRSAHMIGRQPGDDGGAAVGETLSRAMHRAHPDWVIDRPPNAATVVMHGLSPSGTIELTLPRLRVAADYVAGQKRGERELASRMLVLLPDERRFTITYCAKFAVRYVPNEERCFRLRIEGP